MTVEQMLNILQQLKDIGFGNTELTIPVDDYNQWVNGIFKLQYRPFVNCIAICTCSVQAGGIDIKELIQLGGQQNER
jgi:hypothetical protein